MFRSVVMPASLLAMFMAVGCSGGDAETDETDAVACTNVASNPFPASGATDAYYRTTVEINFTKAEETATLTVDGVTGTTAWRGLTLVFTPDAPFAASTQYTATVTSECGTSSWSFTTGAVGASLEAGDLAGKTYSLDLASGRFVQPPGVGSLLSSYLTTQVLVSVASADASNIQMVGAIADSASTTPAQDTCAPTIPFPSADFSANPYFQVGPETTNISISGFDVTIESLEVSGAFTPDGSAISGATLSGKIDTRPLVPLVQPDGADDAICTLAASMFAVQCEECGGENPGAFCLSILVDSIAATAVDTTVTAQTQDDVCAKSECSAEPACATSEDTDTSSSM